MPCTTSIASSLSTPACARLLIQRDQFALAATAPDLRLHRSQSSQALRRALSGAPESARTRATNPAAKPSGVRQKWMPRIICAIATASGDSVGLASFSPLAAALSGNMRKVVFMTICVIRGAATCRISPKMPSVCRHTHRLVDAGLDDHVGGLFGLEQRHVDDQEIDATMLGTQLGHELGATGIVGDVDQSSSRDRCVSSWRHLHSETRRRCAARVPKREDDDFARRDAVVDVVSDSG